MGTTLPGDPQGPEAWPHHPPDSGAPALPGSSPCPAAAIWASSRGNPAMVRHLHRDLPRIPKPSWTRTLPEGLWMGSAQAEGGRGGGDRCACACNTPAPQITLLILDVRVGTRPAGTTF